MGKIIKVMGWVFLILGILGFFSNPIIGMSSGAWFHADFSHDLVHLVTGLILLWVAYKAQTKTRGTLKTFGIIYLLLAVLGWLLVSGTGSLLGLVEVDGVGNWLHLIFGFILISGGLKGSSMSMSQDGQNM